MVETNLYSVTEYFKAAEGGRGRLTGGVFIYDLSPIVMEGERRAEEASGTSSRGASPSWGVFAVTGMTDRWIHRAAELMSKNA